MDVKLATGIRVASQMEVVAAIQLMPDCVHNVTLRVVPELATSVVLGVPWLKEHNPVIDWQNGVVNLDHAGVTK